MEEKKCKLECIQRKNRGRKRNKWQQQRGNTRKTKYSTQMECRKDNWI